MRLAQNAPKRPALRYYGGKWKLAKWIISHFPEHKNYVEPCCGACSVLLQKPRSPLETVNDLDGNVVNFFRVLRDKPDELIRKIRLTPWAREEYELAWQPCEDIMEQSRRFFVHCWMSMDGTANLKSGGTWRVTKHAGDRSFPACAEWLNLDFLEQCAARFLNVQIEHADALEVIGRYDNADTLFYFDPPYPTESRSHKNEYTHEVTAEFHRKAAVALQNTEGYAVISGYVCPLYADMYQAPGWLRIDKEAVNNSGNKRVESLWLSPRTVEALQMPMQASFALE